jgi:hypothetical protein
MKKRNRRTRQPAASVAEEKESRATLTDRQWWVLAAALPAILAASKLNLDFWYDEVYTLEFFVSKPWLKIATDYSAPNNHVLYSLLLKPFYSLSDSEFVLRLPSFACTIGTLLMVFRLARRRAGIPAAVMATLLLGLTQMFLVHTVQVRGYSLSMFLAAWLGTLALPVSPEANWRRLGAIGLAGAAFLYVLPSNVLFFFPLALASVVLAAARTRPSDSCVASSAQGARGFESPFVLRIRRVLGLVATEAAAWVGACLLAGLLYLPILDQVLQARGDSDPAPLKSVITGSAHGFFSAALRDWLPVVVLAFIGLAIWARALYVRREQNQYVLALLILVLLGGPFCVTAISGVRPFVRNYCPMLPFLALVLAWSLACLLEAAGRFVPFARSKQSQAAIGSVLLAAVALPAIWTYPARLAESRRQQKVQDGYFNYYAADYHPSQVASYLARAIDPQEGYSVCFSQADYFPLAFYFRRSGVPLNRNARSSGHSSPVLYLITPPQADYEALSGRCGFPADVLRGFPLIKDFGYYRLYCSAARGNEKSKDWFSS